MGTKTAIKNSLSSPVVRMALLFVQRNSCHNLTLGANGHWLQSLQFALSSFRSHPLSPTPLRVTVQLRSNSASLQLLALPQLSHLTFMFSSECFFYVFVYCCYFWLATNISAVELKCLTNCYADFPSNLWQCSNILANSFYLDN